MPDFESMFVAANELTPTREQSARAIARTREALLKQFRRHRVAVLMRCRDGTMYVKGVPMKISDLISEMQQSLAKHKKGELGLGWRIRLWSTMKTKYGEEAEFRRNVLALLVARDTFSVWEHGQLIEALPTDRIDIYYAYPRNALDEYRRYLLGKSSLKKVAVIHGEMLDVLDYWRAKPHLPMQGAYISIAAVAARLRGFDDDIYKEQGWFDEVWDDDGHLKITDDSLGERESCDTHFFASLVATHLSKKKVDSRREFWRRWLSESVPAVLAPIAKVKSRL